MNEVELFQPAGESIFLIRSINYFTKNDVRKSISTSASHFPLMNF